MKGISESIVEALARDTMEFGGIPLSKTRFKYRFMVYDPNSESIFGIQFNDVDAFIEEYGDEEVAMAITKLKFAESYHHKSTGMVYTNIVE